LILPTLIEKDSIVPDEKHVVFIGDSITDNGLYIAMMDAYFRQHMPGNKITLINLGVSSETASGLSEPDHPFPRPCIHDRLDQVLRESRPDWVVIGYGMNDGIYYPFAEERLQAYQEGILKVVRAVKQSGARAILMTPPLFDAESFRSGELQSSADKEAYSWKSPYRNYNEVLGRYVKWLVSVGGEEADVVVNIYDSLGAGLQAERKRNPEYVSGDGIHPNAKGHWIIARTLLSRLFNITLERVPDYVEHSDSSELFQLVLERHRLLSSAWKEHVGHTNPGKVQALPLDEALEQGSVLEEQICKVLSKLADPHMERTSEWNGYVQKEFYLNGREGIVICPKIPAPGNPWVWRMEFLHAFNTADLALLDQGWHIAYHRLSHMYGCPYAVNLLHQFHNHMEQYYALSPRPTIFGFSRGGLYAFNYAVSYPDQVSVLYLDAPVLDIRSWPGGKGEGSGSPQQWEECLAVYGLTEEESRTFNRNPLDYADKAAIAGIPILLVAGDADLAVPFSENAAVLERRYRENNGTIQVIVKPGVGHHPHSLEHPEPLIEFILRQK
jgi:lysophospholipase L1-like esterase/pimeloyl-ACP methyl ester carboxylesterase